MAESLTLTGQMHLSTVQAQFTNLFPRLGIVFFSSDEYQKVKRNEIATPMSTDLTVASVRTRRGDDISLHGNWQVRNFEKAFADRYGLFVQICLCSRSRGSVVYTDSDLDDLTLRDLNDKAAAAEIPEFQY